MMSYYRIGRDRAQSLGIDLFAHFVSETEAVVSDMDLRRVSGFGSSPEQMREEYGIQPLDASQIAEIQRDPEWSYLKERGQWEG